MSVGIKETRVNQQPAGYRAGIRQSQLIVRIAILRRKKGSSPGTWSCPAGWQVGTAVMEDATEFTAPWNMHVLVPAGFRSSRNIQSSGR